MSFAFWLATSCERDQAKTVRPPFAPLSLRRMSSFRPAIGLCFRIFAACGDGTDGTDESKMGERDDKRVRDVATVERIIMQTSEAVTVLKSLSCEDEDHRAPALARLEEQVRNTLATCSEVDSVLVLLPRIRRMGHLSPWKDVKIKNWNP